MRIVLISCKTILRHSLQRYVSETVVGKRSFELHIRVGLHEALFNATKNIVSPEQTATTNLARTFGGEEPVPLPR